ncbi:MAG: NUDIX hydrolase [Candidatus Kerfeldbacteria bacterium]|nr:NUDIX hydrolase [Candidatus Kerfeldbacteria bacterium]
MSKPGDKDWLPHDEYLRRVPKKRVSAGVIFLNSRREVLMVKPTYKSVWVIPGGVINQYESPQDGAIREVHEETGLTVSSPQFIGVVHAPRPGEGDDVMHFFFYGGVLSDDVQLTLQAAELETWKFMPVADVSRYAVPQFAARLTSLLTAIEDQRPVYIQEPSVVDGGRI